MMDEARIRWQQLPGGMRILLLALVCLSCAWLLKQAVLQPQWHNAQRLQQDVTQLQAHYQSRLLVLNEKRPLAELVAENLALQEQLKFATEATHTFELATLLEESGGTLQKWSPQRNGAELTLQLEWPQLQRLYIWLLARPRPLLPNRLHLRPQGAQLSATFYWLSTHDEA